MLGTAVLPLAGCITLSKPQQQAMREATFNIWHDAGNWPARLPILVRLLREADADRGGLKNLDSGISGFSV